MTENSNLDLISLFQDSDTIEDHAAGETIFHEGSEGRDMYVVLDGDVNLTINNQPIGIIKPGGFFGEMALIDSKPRSATSKAGTNCRLARIDETKFLDMVQKNPIFSLHVMRVLTERLRNMDAKILS